jgi:hypothetical protein
VNQPNATVEVYIGGSLRGTYTIAYGDRTSHVDWGLNDGPVRVVSTNGTPIIVSERSYRDPVNLEDFNEMMGVPADHLTTEYWFPVYNGNTSVMKTWITIGNAQ